MSSEQMDPIKKELESRRKEIAAELALLFKTNMKITDWDVPEADDREAAELLLQIMQEELDKLKEDVRAGKYDNY
ncbi:hypothetical protein [Nitratifractor salsuginis]|uniref:Uncharacterized protein n=1 Tax=Nitratifractor salsuginis (strain DSM 16511 / JCM 12458 / E9I37-1) TaxID=749222 RepID=E6X2R6_NITSE|nr:hypothetical protein [Nitratifractor salsuginis]ADV46132.1 hypothetical protein Nitsa_0872 [Nitratifractor salsuginis DSM 16511]